MVQPIARRAAVLAAPALLAAGAARAQAWPSRPVRLVVGFAAGGANDIMARLLAAKLSERIPGSSFIVENRPGASTQVAADLVARAAPDGTTFMYTSPSTLIALAVNRSATLDPVQAFAPVFLAQNSPLALVCRADFPARTVAEFIAVARERQGRLTVSTPGAGAINHLALILLSKQAGIEVTHVPYAGNQPSITALIRGEVDVAHDGLFAPRAQIEAGSLRAIAVTSAQRAPAYPNVPTFAETVPGHVVGFWGGVLAPRGTPEPILDRLNTELDAVMKLPDVIERTRSFGAEPAGGSRQAFTRVVADDWARWGQVVRENNIRAE
jgi:tripartite-type tricarboxylate transporter receptor subunit TctC